MANETEKKPRLHKPRRTPRPQNANEPLPPKLKVLVTVVNRNKAEVYLALLQSFEINMQLAMAAEGTADTTMLNYLGLTDSDKAVIFSVIREDKEETVLRYLDEKFRTIKNGKGIAFTIPMTGVIGVAIYQFLSNHTEGRG